MYSHSQTATLALKTSDLTLNTTNAYGTANQYGTNYTWNNINLRVLLGDMYDKYERFNLQLIEISSANPVAVPGTTADDRCTYVSLYGLPWVNNSYQQKNNTNNNEAIIGTIYWSDTNSTAQVYLNNSVTFNKPQELCNFNISFYKMSTGLTPTTTNAFPKLIFIFKIVGVEEYRTKITDERMDFYNNKKI